MDCCYSQAQQDKREDEVPVDGEEEVRFSVSAVYGTGGGEAKTGRNHPTAA